MAAVGLAALLVAPLEPPWRLIRNLPITSQAMDGVLGFFEVGRSATVTVRDQRGAWRLASNGLPEATIQPPGARSSSTLSDPCPDSGSKRAFSPREE